MSNGLQGIAAHLLHLGVLLRRHSLDARKLLEKLRAATLPSALTDAESALVKAVNSINFAEAEERFTPFQNWALKHYDAKWVPSEYVSNRPRVLVIEDDPLIIELIASILGNVELLAARSGLEGLRIASWESPDLILLDIGLPDVPGWDILRLLRQDPRTQRSLIIFLTGADSEENEVRGLEAGAIDYITKPIRPAILRSRVVNHLELKRHRDFFEQLAHLDGLTGLANRRRFDSHLQTEWDRAIHIGSPISLAMGDLDHFKLFNDALGHLAGDDLLRRAGKAFLSVPHRPADLLARYGGEEFACILPDTGLDGALLVADRMRHALEELGVTHPGNASGIATVSFGAATLYPKEGESSDLLIAAADKWLYQSKARGGNIVTSIESDDIA